MHWELICATPTWCDGPPRYDCVFLNSNPDQEGMRGLDIVQVLLFFAIPFCGKLYPCALIQWYKRIGDGLHPDMSMWIMEPERENGEHIISMIHLDCIVRAAHLIPVFREHRVPDGLNFTDSLDAFRAFYVSKFIDHHAFEIAF
jgi:hypothetical protein